MRFVFLALLLAAFSQAHAQRGALVWPLPEGADNQRILQVTREVLVARGWSLVSLERDTIDAKKGLSAMRVFVDGTAVRFSDQSLGPRMRQRNREEGPKLAAIPQGEIDALRADLVAAFAGKPLAAGASPATPPSSGILLMGNLPANLANDQILRVVWTALSGRRWVVLPSSSDTVVAEYSGGDTEGKLKVFILGRDLRYTDEGTRQRFAGTPTTLPENWIVNLRADTAKGLRQLSAAPAAKPPAAGSAARTTAERLRVLKELHDSGAITRDEYEKKRNEVLKDI